MFNAGNTFNGNPKWLFLYVNRYRPDIEAHWITDSEDVVAQVQAMGFSAMTFRGPKSREVQRRTGVWVVNQVKEHLPENLRGAVLLNLWHGVGVKRVERAMTTGFLLPRIVEKYVRNNVEYRRNQLFLVTSPTMEEHFAAQIDPAPTQVIRAGYPQNLFSRLHGRFASFDHDLRAARGLPASTRMLMWAPTYRLRGNETFVARALPDVDRLLESLERSDSMLILKLHPQLAVDRTYRALKARYGDHPRLVFWDNADDVYEVFPDLDTVIVDYSSILYDALNAGVERVIRYPFDWGDETALEPGLDYERLSAGRWAGDFDALLEAIEDRDTVVPGEDLERLDETFWAYADDDTFTTIVEHALAYEPIDVRLPTLYSFDVFDTLIHRRAVLPESIFHGVRQRMELSPTAFPGELLARFPEIRMQAEAAVREYRRKSPALANSQEFEIQFDDIYRRIREIFHLTDEQVDLLSGWELELEVENCIADERMLAHVRSLVEAGETVVLISDMYLPKQTLVRMLGHADPLLATLPLYLSSEQLVQKTTKRLFARVFTDLGYDYGAWIHTGDNLRADEVLPRELGIRTVRTETPTLDEYETEFVESIRSYDAYLLAGRMRDRRMSGEFTEAELFAYRTASFYLVPYVSWVLADAVRRGYETLYFISRDGHHMKEIADALIASRGLELRTEYIYGSRRAWRLASQLDGIDDDTFAPHGSFGGVRTFAGLLESSRTTEDELLAMFPEFAQYRDAPFDGATAGGIVETMRSSGAYRAHLERVAEADRELVTEYLRDHVDLDGRIAFVEYWGRGYTQDCLARLLEVAAGRPVESPFYYARSIYPSNGVSVRHNFTSATYSLLVIEALFANLPYGSVTGYERRDGRVEPVMASRSHDRELYEAFERMLPMFANDVADLDFIDRDRLRRDVFAFGFEHFRAHPGAPEYLRFIAPLRDAVELGSHEREFAPALRVRDVVDYLRGKPMGEITRSLALTMERSNGIAPWLLRMQKEVGFRRVVKGAVARAREIVTRPSP
ncbi:hypothetical protein GCM10009819_27840 [Agromyces tropicus]|uniref:CDP-glycerol glycerophosphotransferase n=2 Tax=Agromyces tropicus TaxID=555371 RepID=A0ABN2UQM4_9MICO